VRVRARGKVRVRARARVNVIVWETEHTMLRHLEREHPLGRAAQRRRQALTQLDEAYPAVRRLADALCSVDAHPAHARVVL
jgi:hypothetical protein